MNDPEHVQATGRHWIVIVFGDITLRGSWPSRDGLSPVAVFGDIDLDFRQIHCGERDNHGAVLRTTNIAAAEPSRPMS